jgi:hypothetical protein
MDSVIVILTGQKDYPDWIEVVKTVATAKGVWKYVNPAEASPIPEPTTPHRPTANDVKPSTNATPTTFSQLDGNQIEELRNLQIDYSRDLKNFDREVAGLGELRAFIQRTVARDNLIYTFNCDTVHGILVSLRNRFSPTAEYREREVLERWNELKRGLQRGTEVDFWLTRWEKAYTDGKALDIPDVAKTRPIRDFLAAVSPTSPGFSDYWQNRLMDDGSVIPDFYSLVQKYREYRAENPERRLAATHSAFGPTLNGRNPNGTRSPCLCGDDHRFSKCPYLIPQEQPDGWVGDKAKIQKVQEALVSDRLRDLVEDLRRNAITFEKKGASTATHWKKPTNF